MLAHPADLGFLGPTLDHQLRHLAACPAIDRRVVVADMSNATPDGISRLRAMLHERRAAGRLDDVIELDWSTAAVHRVMDRWYGDPHAPPRAARGRARYQYAASIDLAQRQLVFHSDILLWGSTGWLERAVAQLRAEPAAIAVVPMAGAPQATDLRTWWTDRRGIGTEPRARRNVPRDRPLPWPPGVACETSLTTRHVVVDRERLARLLPLQVDGEEQLEASLARRMAECGALRLTEVSADGRAWHPHVHNRAHARHIVGLIGLVEAGRYPYLRSGHPWDISTEGRGFLPWRVALARDRLRRHP